MKIQQTNNKSKTVSHKDSSNYDQVQDELLSNQSPQIESRGISRVSSHIDYKQAVDNTKPKTFMTGLLDQYNQPHQITLKKLDDCVEGVEDQF